MPVLQKMALLNHKTEEGDRELLYPITLFECVDGLDEALSEKVSSEEGKALSTHDFDDNAYNKLNNIESGAQVNVQSDWSESDTNSERFIRHKPESLPANGGNSATVNGHTVEANVPSNALFTDTLYVHPDVSLEVGTYTKITIDSKGHVVNATNPTTLEGYGITDAATSEQGDKADTAVQRINLGEDSYIGTTITLPDYPTSLPASDVYAWAKGALKPVYTYDEVGADAAGAALVALNDAKSYTDEKISDLINQAPETLDTLGEIATALRTNQDAVDILNSAIGTKANSSDLTTHTSDSVVHITSTERTNWNSAKTHADSNHAPSDAERNQIISIKKNGTTLSIDQNRAIDIPIPTKVSDLENDSGFKTSDNNTTYTFASSGRSQTNGNVALTLSGSDVSSNSVSIIGSGVTNVKTNNDGAVVVETLASDVQVGFTYSNETLVISNAEINVGSSESEDNEGE